MNRRLQCEVGVRPKQESRCEVFQRFKIIADSRDVARSVAISAVATAISVYAMVVQERSATIVLLGALVVLVTCGAMLQVSWAVRRLHRKQQETRDAAAAAERHYFTVLRRIQAAFEDREPYTRGRSRRIAFLARRIGEQMNLPPRQCQLLAMAGQVQDIGLLGVPDYILNKPSRLGTQEVNALQKHAEISSQILEPLTFLSEMLPAIGAHHERMNGTGYPRGLKGEEIPLPARILAVADAFDGMTHDRPHRPALSTMEALEELRRCSPAGFDPRCVEALAEAMNMRHLRAAHAAGAGSRSQPAPARVSALTQAAC